MMKRAWNSLPLFDRLLIAGVRSMRQRIQNDQFVVSALMLRTLKPDHCSAQETAVLLDDVVSFHNSRKADREGRAAGQARSRP